MRIDNDGYNIRNYLFHLVRGHNGGCVLRSGLQILLFARTMVGLGILGFVASVPCRVYGLLLVG